MIGPEPEPTGSDDAWFDSLRRSGRTAVRSARSPGPARSAAGRLSSRANRLLAPRSLRSQPGRRAGDVERALGARRGGLEILSLGDGSTWSSRSARRRSSRRRTRVSTWTGPLAIGHTRLSTESRIDLSHSQPFWVHGVPDLATVHNGHVTNYHQLRRRYEQQGVIFYTDNDSEVIGVYLRDRMKQGRSLPEALADSVADLDGAFNYLVASTEGLGVVRDRYGFKPLVLAETDDFVAVATEEIALRRAFPGRLFRGRAAARLRAVLPVEDCMSTECVAAIDRRRAVTIDCGDLSVRAINQAIRSAIASGCERRFACSGPPARHNLGVALPGGRRAHDRRERRLLRRGLERRCHGSGARRSGMGGRREHA